MNRTVFAQCASILFAAGAPLLGAEPNFRVVPVNEQSEYLACAVFDVNNDGKLDIFSGGWWYEWPSARRHFVRDVQQIRGRYDDYSNLLVDVNADGWTDVVSCNYRSATMYWVRNPGFEQPSDRSDSAKGWERILIEQDSPMETGRLVDLNGDGRLDILPNGTEHAAWWSYVPQTEPKWMRHELPPPLAGHGLGAGDLNGDGRVDLVARDGWCEALPGGSWQMRGEFRLHRDSSVPILVHDVDRDGDNDLVWGRGHNVGLYWLEQQTVAGARTWQQHTIDTSWSQAHSLLLADVDGDEATELIAGKRYMGHDGRDIGEYDPLGIFWYRFNPHSRSWQRGTISAHPRAGFGLDPKACDIDGDGDIDVLAADCSGLYLCENIGAEPPPESAPEPSFHPISHQQLLDVRLADGDERSLSTASEFATRRQLILAGMTEAMGALPGPELRVPVDIEVHEETDMGAYVRKRISYSPNPGDRVPAYLLLPDGLGGPAPAMLCLHQTTNIGKGEPVGLGGRVNLRYADELARRGYVCLAPDYPSFGDYEFDFAAARQHFPSGSLKAIWNNMRGVDLLESLPQVDPDRIGCIGHSLGGHNTLFTAAFDQRIKVAVTSCGFTAFHHYYGGDLKGWTSDRYMPRIRDEYGNDPDRMPFDFYEVLAAIAPRAVFVCAPLKDDNFEVAGVRQVESEVRKVYDLFHSPDRMRYVYPDFQHDFPPESREEAYAFVERMLGAR